MQKRSSRCSCRLRRAGHLLCFQALLTAGPVAAQTADLQNIRVWESVFAGHSRINGDAARGTQSIIAGVVGTTIGADTQLEDGTLLGASLGSSHQTFSSGSSGSGNGRSEDVLLTLYGRQHLFENAYVAEALGYGWHDVSTSRTVTVSGTDVLSANFLAHDIGGRIEGGYNFAWAGGATLSPYAAFVGDAYAEPAYGEVAKSGAPTFAVSYAASLIGVTHMELGSRYYCNFTWNNATISVDALAGWERELGDNPLVFASFQTVPHSNFVLRGTSPEEDTALLGLGARLQPWSGFTLGFRGDGRFGDRTTILAATADLTYRW